MKLDPQSIIAEIHRLTAQALELEKYNTYRAEVGQNLPANYPPELALIVMTTAEALEKEGVGRVQALSVGFVVAERVRAAFGGAQIYIPMGDNVDALHEQIYADWRRGVLPKQLAQDYNRSVNTIYKIVKAKQSNHTHQPGLFDDAA